MAQLHLIHVPNITDKSRGKAIGIATGYGLDEREVGVQVPVGSSRSHITTDSQSVSESWCQAPIQDPRQIFLSP
jgi:hypothetical protein